MSTQTYTLGVDTHPDTLLDTSIFDDKTFQSYLNSDIDSILNNASASQSSAGSPHNLFEYDPLSYYQSHNNTQFSIPKGFQKDHIDPSLVLPPPTILNGNTPILSKPQSVQIGQNKWGTKTAASGIIPAINLSKLSNSNTNGVKKRRSRKKKAPLPPAVKEEKRRDFREKNRIAARKCREKNRKKWDCIQEQCVDLEMQNKALKERRAELKDEVENLAKLVAEHRECVNKEMDEWIEEYKTNIPARELDLESETWNSPAGDPTSSPRDGTRSVQDDGEHYKTEEGHEVTTAADSTIAIGEQNEASLPEIYPASSANSNSPQTLDDSFSAPMDVEIDMNSFIEDEEVPALSPLSRKTSAASIDFDFQVAPTGKDGKLVLSPADSGVDLTADLNMSYETLEKEQREGLKIVGQDEELIQHASMFSMC